MAVPAYTPTGAVTTTLNLNANFAAQTSTLPPVQTAYIQNILGNPIAALQYQTNGTGAAQLNKILVASGALTTSGSATINIATAVDISGTTASIAHVRELWIFNDGNTAGFSTADSDVLTWDTTIANSFGVGAAGTGPLETASKVDIPNGTSLRFSKPYGTNGWTVSTTNIITLSAPTNTHSINYRVIVAGD